MKFRCALLAAALVPAAFAGPVRAQAPAQPQVVDMTVMKCAEFLKSGKDAIAYIVIWLDGYYTDQDASAVMDFGKIAAKIEKFGEYCSKNQNSSISDAAEELLGK